MLTPRPLSGPRTPPPSSRKPSGGALAVNMTSRTEH
jgi:hypothetical protein